MKAATLTIDELKKAVQRHHEQQIEESERISAIAKRFDVRFPLAFTKTLSTDAIDFLRMAQSLIMVGVPAHPRDAAKINARLRQLDDAKAEWEKTQ